MTSMQADIEALSHADPYVRAAAAKRLGEARCTEALEPMVACLNWRQDDVEDEIEGRIGAALALGKLGDPRAIPPLIAVLESWFAGALDEVSLTCDVMIALADLRAEQALPLLEAFARDSDYDQIKTAMWCLRRYPRSDAVWDLVMRLAADRSWMHRGLAVENLGLLGDTRATELLVTIMEDKSEEQWVRDYAAGALGRIGGAGIFERLFASFLDAGGNDYARIPFVRGLGYLGDQRAFEPLCKALETTDWPVFVIEALGNLRDPRAVPVLIGCLQDRRAQVVEKTAIGLGQLGDARAMEPLRSVRPQCTDHDACWGVRKAIDEALAKLTSQSRATW